MIITLTTDFGLGDPFVGIMKGVILGIAPDVQIVDLTHEIQSYDIAEAAFLVESSFRYFPAGSIHLVVVDPGVGTTRRPIAAHAREHYFIAPDNGVLWPLLHPESPSAVPAVYRITRESLFRQPVSNTFHGRDIFAPVAAHLAQGTPIDSVGERVADYASAPLPKPRPSGEKGLAAGILRIDKFGNIITNLRRRDLKAGFTIRIGGLTISRVCRTFAEAAPGELVAVEGSTGYVEIVMNQASAAERLQAVRGMEIEVETGLGNH